MGDYLGKVEIVYKFFIAAKLTERIRKALKDHDAEEIPPKMVQWHSLNECASEILCG